jgi:molybdenum cofactor biosynthesis enzyme MoaA
MPEEGVPLTPAPRLLTADEVVRAASVFVRAGVDKIRLTGGEPTLRPDLVAIASRLRALPGLETLAMTTNGLLLERLLPALVDAGLSAVNISLDTLKPATFARLTRRPEAGWHRVMAAIHAAVACEGVQRSAPVKVNAVVVRGENDGEVADFVRLTTRLPVQVRFIEFMPFPGNAYEARKTVGWREMVDGVVRGGFPDFRPMGRGDSGGRGDGGPDEGASSSTGGRLYHVPGAPGSVGFISTMTDAFCGTCDRLRLTADGNVRACLHGREEHGLRAALRSGADDDALLGLIAEAVRGKHAALGGSRGADGLAQAAAAADREGERGGEGGGGARGGARPMVAIGG